MEFEQLIKRLDWLDEEHRKSKTATSDLEERLSSVEGELKALTKKVKSLGNELSRISTAAARIEQFDEANAQQRTELTKLIDSLEKRHADAHKETDKRFQVQIDGIQKSILKKMKEAVSEIKREMKAQEEEESRRSRLMSEWEARMQGMVKAGDDIQRELRVFEEARRQDGKRLNDLQGEVSAGRKRLEEVREKSDLFTDSIRRIETRLNEILANETERRQAQVNFIETQARLQVERDRVWKDWEDRFEILRKQTESMDSQLAQWDSAQRAVKRAQETYEDIVQKFDRRINEITEIQRLAEDRLRQEWVTFKSDDQKRWTSYTLSQEETRKDSRTLLDKLLERVTSLEDLTQAQQDVLQQTKEANEQLLQSMLSQIHELLTAYERILGATK